MPAAQILAGAVTAIVLIALTVPWVRRRFAKTEPDLVKLATVAVVAKILASIARYFVAYQIYGGVADVAGYYKSGAELAPQFRHFDFNVHVGRVIGTGFTKIITGVVFAVTGVSEIGGFFIFSWLGFLGLWLFYRAFRLAVPEGDHRSYFWLVFLLPSMLFWPSEIGKEAWMTLALGVSAYGAARILTRRPWGYVLMLTGCAATAMVRPHVTVLFLGAFLVAFLLRRDRAAQNQSSGQKARRGSKIIGIVLLSAAMLLGVTRANSFFASDGLANNSNGGGLTAILQGTSLRTSEGGSRFTPASLTHPWTIPYAVLSVTFRPFPWEARNVQSLLSSGEGGLLLYLVWRSRRRLRNLWPWIRERPYIALCLLYSALFAFAFSAVGNFGILARERVMQFPFFVVLLSLPAFRPGTAPSDAVAAEGETELVPASPIMAIGTAPLSRDPLAGVDGLLSAAGPRLGKRPSGVAKKSY